jgi:anti-sigma factor RsiW
VPFRRWFHRRRDLVCREAVAMLSSYLDGALPPDDTRRLEAHLADCPNCSEYVEQFRTTIAAVGSVEPEELEPQVRDELVELYRRWRSD